MIEFGLFVLTLSFAYFVLLFALPLRWVKAIPADQLPQKLPKLYVYSYQVHIHTQFSYDSLGKPEDIFNAMEAEDIDFALITDHDNDHFKHFCNHRCLAGVERKIDGEKGSLGDLLEIGSLKVIAHPFKEKYRWKLERDGYFLELIDLKDALLEDKGKFFFFLFGTVLLYPFLKKRALELLKKVLPVEKYAQRYMQEGWKNPVLGGLDYHTKVYVREVGIRFLFPSYEHSFYLMRNLLISQKPVNSAEELTNALRSGLSLISFQRKPFLAYVEEGKLRLLAPCGPLLVAHLTEKGRDFYLGENLILPLAEGRNVYVCFSYAFKLGRLYLGLKPAAVIVLPSPLEFFPEDVEKASMGMGV